MVEPPPKGCRVGAGAKGVIYRPRASAHVRAEVAIPLLPWLQECGARHLWWYGSSGGREDGQSLADATPGRANPGRFSSRDLTGHVTGREMSLGSRRIDIHQEFSMTGAVILVSHMILSAVPNDRE